MYCYYACSAINIHWPNWAKQSVTTLQLSQMIFGLGILTTSYVKCPYDESLLVGGFAMYFSYFVLFAILFYDLYFNPNARPTGGKTGGTAAPGSPKPTKPRKVD